MTLHEFHTFQKKCNEFVRTLNERYPSPDPFRVTFANVRARVSRYSPKTGLRVYVWGYVEYASEALTKRHTDFTPYKHDTRYGTLDNPNWDLISAQGVGRT